MNSATNGSKAVLFSKNMVYISIFLNSYSSEFRKVMRSKSEFSYPIFHDENDDGDEGNGDGEHGRQLNNEKPVEKSQKRE